MDCHVCGGSSQPGARFCPHCGASLRAAAGAPPQPPTGPPPGKAPAAPPFRPPQPAQETVQNPLATWSLVLGLLGILTGGISALAGLILGIVAMSQIQSSNGRQRGTEMAISGIVISVVLGLMLPIMAAIVFPVFARAREKARQSSCMSNEKHIGLGLLMYCQDWDQRHPPATTWQPCILPYVKNEAIFICPSAPGFSPTERHGRSSYGFNQNLSGFSLKYLQSPAETVMVFETQPGVSPYGGADQVVSRHNGGANFGFSDGHCKWMSEGAFDRLVWAPNEAYGTPSRNAPPQMRFR